MNYTQADIDHALRHANEATLKGLVRELWNHIQEFNRGDEDLAKPQVAEEFITTIETEDEDSVSDEDA